MASLRRKPIEYDAGDGLPAARLWLRMPSLATLARLRAVSGTPRPIKADTSAAIDVAVEATVRWERVTDETGQVEQACTEENRRLFYEEHDAAAALVVGWLTRQLITLGEQKKSLQGGSDGNSGRAPGSRAGEASTATEPSMAAPP